MSSLTNPEKRYFEKLLGMGSGYVLDFTESTFGEFFRHFGIDIHGRKYLTNGSSKAKKLRAFWEKEDDDLVAAVLTELLNSYETASELEGGEVPSRLMGKCREIVARLSGDDPTEASDAAKRFLYQEFAIPDIGKLPVEAPVAAVIKHRIAEARKAFEAKAHLSAIFLCGSVLEGVLLGAAETDPKRFNQSPASPKNRDDKVLPLHHWSLAQLIGTACDIRLIKPDVQKFSHGLRDFRNYIHPREQVRSGFTPDEHTAKVCFQVLKVALASLSGDRE